jgi:hypothetical protein
VYPFEELRDPKGKGAWDGDSDEARMHREKQDPENKGFRLPLTYIRHRINRGKT